MNIKGTCEIFIFTEIATDIGNTVTSFDRASIQVLRKIYILTSSNYLSERCVPCSQETHQKYHISPI